MRTMRFSWAAAVLIGALTLSCTQKPRRVTLAYTPDLVSLTATLTMKAFLQEHLGHPVGMLPVESAGDLWKAVADGEADATVSAWLPTRHNYLYEQYQDSVTDLGPHMTGTRLGMVVIGDADIDSISQLKGRSEDFTGQILVPAGDRIALDKANQAVTVYDLSEKYRIVPVSEEAMARFGDHPVGRPAVAVTWTPTELTALHANHIRWLIDRLENFTAQGGIHTVVHAGRVEDRTDLRKLLDHFAWERKQLDSLTSVVARDTASRYDHARAWAEKNALALDVWLGGEADL